MPLPFVLLLLDSVHGALSSMHARSAIAVFVSSLLFGAAHAAGGISAIAIAVVSGLGYAGVYAATRRIEAPILVHFAMNATHFLLFTFPMQAGRWLVHTFG